MDENSDVPWTTATSRTLYRTIDVVDYDHLLSLGAAETSYPRRPAKKTYLELAEDLEYCESKARVLSYREKHYPPHNRRSAVVRRRQMDNVKLCETRVRNELDALLSLMFETDAPPGDGATGDSDVGRILYETLLLDETDRVLSYAELARVKLPKQRRGRKRKQPPEEEDVALAKKYSHLKEEFEYCDGMIKVLSYETKHYPLRFQLSKDFRRWKIRTLNECKTSYKNKLDELIRTKFKV